VPVAHSFPSGNYCSFTLKMEPGRVSGGTTIAFAASQHVPQQLRLRLVPRLARGRRRQMHKRRGHVGGAGFLGGREGEEESSCFSIRGRVPASQPACQPASQPASQSASKPASQPAAEA